MKIIIAALVFAGVGMCAEFEVASVKSNGPWDRDRPSSQRGGPGTSDPDRITFENVPLITVIGKAYGVGDYGRISGPEWLSADQFTFAVKLPAGATKEVETVCHALPVTVNVNVASTVLPSALPFRRVTTTDG